MQLAARQKTNLQRATINYEGIDGMINSLGFEECEEVIEWGLKRFYAVGKALAKIRENNWYKTLGFSSFEEYCKQRWGMKKSHAYRLIASSEVMDNLSPIGDTLPSTENQARELARLDPDEQIDAWQEVKDTYEPEEITAAKVAEIVDRRKSPVRRLSKREKEEIELRERFEQEQNEIPPLFKPRLKVDQCVEEEEDIEYEDDDTEPKFTTEQIKTALKKAFKKIDLSMATDSDQLFVFLLKELKLNQV